MIININNIIIYNEHLEEVKSNLNENDLVF